MPPTRIEWAQHSWNPVAGCTRVSAGCDNCYAVAMTRRLSHLPGYAGLVEKGKGHFNGRIELHPDALNIPLRRKKPTTYFVNSMSDLFHEAIPLPFIWRVFAVAALTPHHRYIVLTKRPVEAQAAILLGAPQPDFGTGIAEEVPAWYRAVTKWLDEGEQGILGKTWERCHEAAGQADLGRAIPSNMILGVSCENQATYNVRVPVLLNTPAAIRCVSLEPLLGPIDLTGCLLGGTTNNFLDWVIVGGESGPGARPCDVEWIRSIVRQCKAAGVRCFVKQLGAKTMQWMQHCYRDPPRQIKLADAKGGEPAEWPADLRVREVPWSV